MENPRNLPFAMYDLAVYLPGGAVSLLLANQMAGELLGRPLPVSFGSATDTTVGQAMLAVVWLSASYLAGHIVAFISSYVIEKFLHNKLGYPSDNWIASERYLSHGTLRKDIFKKIYSRNLSRAPKYWVPRLLVLAQLPAIVPLIAVRILKPFGFYTHKLPHGLLPKVADKFDRLQIGVPIQNESRWEKILEHHVANNCPLAYTRMYNYLVIYGVLRTLALLVLFYLWLLLAVDIMIRWDGEWKWAWRQTVFYWMLSAIYVLCLMAFAKFNRRYFEETILAFLLVVSDDPSLRAR